ncbi:MAG: chemotaxis protein CheW [Marinobacter sp.]|uniref:chemotaxis protein CheW n=1 Tax=Marinobacter sp. TaxID=50741 RepID=UPI00299EFD3C|nr:chemotaxis protein CheW [Marinobacter sp.]MDX1756660.1 chemotaxis protein CheW [Marinobacter sp.]
MTSGRKTGLADPDYALASYLDELLHTATDAAKDQEQDSGAAERTAEPPPADQVVEPAVEVSPEPAPAPVAAAPQTDVADATPSALAEPAAREIPVAPPAPAPEIQTVPSKRPEQGEPDARPEWSERPFECLLFRVAGLQLAVPLILLGAIHRLEEDVKAMPGSPRWYMGILPERTQNLRVVDTAEWIMAGRVPAGARDHYRFVIRLDNSEWALACDDVAQSFTLDPDQVRWRTSRSKRPWLAGTVVSHMCALIDVSTMARLLVRAEREHHLSLE